MGIVIIRQDDKIEAWKNAIQTFDPKVEVYSYLEDHSKEEISMVLVWKPPHGIIGQYPNLKCIASAGAGVDFIFEEEDLPSVPITRVVDPVLASDMSEFVLALTLNHLKNLNTYKADQSAQQWVPRPYLRIKDVTIGILGLGTLGQAVAADMLKLGFKVQGWARSSKELEGITSFSGPEELSTFLATTSILVCLLPLTKETEGILNVDLFEQLPKGSYIINVARGAHLNAADLIKALDREQLSGASLDVFHTEPLPKTHALWQHPKVHITPHVASVSDPQAVVPQIMENYYRLESGKALYNVVSSQKGY
ncbi:2-hydroxyacid dehydrogenase [Spongiimicrobium salis]|uniref:2-hydroxyacid dehydrogenase n=1 Tax=Spongiimicrobium salis TaxID=1667022 RepID=UPI00374D677A